MASVLNSLGYQARVVPVSPDTYFEVVSDSRTRAQAGYWRSEIAPRCASVLSPEDGDARLIGESDALPLGAGHQSSSGATVRLNFL
jgi:hypothetical protein